MGINGLSQLIQREAPSAIRKTGLDDYRGKTMALDASLAIFQVVMAKAHFASFHSLNLSGEFVGHLTGILGRTLWLLEASITPVFVFDGAPPALKELTIRQRTTGREKAGNRLQTLLKAPGTPDPKVVKTLKAQSTRLSGAYFEECFEMLRLCGVPVIRAPSEAEAQCAELARGKLVYAAATEDMDCLTFGTPVLVRYLNSGHKGKDNPMMEYRLKDVLKGLHLTQSQFNDLCILLGCDYCGRIHGIGPIAAYKGIRQHKTLERFMKHLDPEKYFVTPEFGFYDEARKLFVKPDVIPAKKLGHLKAVPPDIPKLERWLIKKGVHNVSDIGKATARLDKAFQKMTLHHL